jgi:alpha-beta hydrolase superfamily lysophospholipase
MGLKIIIAICVAVVVPAVAIAGLASRPLDLHRIDAQQQPFVEQSARRAAGAGCGLNERRGNGRCEPVATTFESLPIQFPSSYPKRGLEELAGTLTLPQALEGQRPGVVLIGGSGPTQRDGETIGNLVVRHAPFAFLKTMAEMLSRQGLVVLRYDKRSCAGCYPGSHVDTSGFRFHHLIDDALDAVKYLQGREEVDGSHIIVAGHSQGGQLAPFVAHAAEGVAGVILLAATTQTMEVGLIGQLNRLKQLRLDQYDLLGALTARAQRDHYRRCFERIRADFVADEMCIGGGVTQQALKEGEAMAAKTVEKAATLPVPVLAIQGALDRNIDPAVITGLRDALAGRDASVHYVSGVGHTLTDAYRPAEPRLAPAVEEAIVTFLRSIRRE